MGRWEILIAIVLLLLLASPVMPADSPVIGVIKTIKGSALIIRNQQAIPAAIGLKLLVNDTLQTRTDSSMGLILRDDSLLSMGPSSQLIIDQFIFSPQESKLGFLIKMVRGTANYLSGIIGKLSPGTAKFETPIATIGIRGTHFVVKVQR